MASGVSAARECAYAVVRRVFEHDAYADRAFHAEAASRHLEGRDRAFAMALAYGTVQRKATLDHVATELHRSGLLDVLVNASGQALLAAPRPAVGIWRRCR